MHRKIRVPVFNLLLITCLTCFIGGCATSHEEKGAKNHWRNPELPAWTIGRTTETDVLETLGPPSQIISLGDQIVYYYMQELSLGKSYIFIIWNRSEKTVRYDRAVFFFDKKGILKNFAYSPEAFPYVPEQ